MTITWPYDVIYAQNVMIMFRNVIYNLPYDVIDAQNDTWSFRMHVTNYGCLSIHPHIATLFSHKTVQSRHCLTLNKHCNVSTNQFYLTQPINNNVSSTIYYSNTTSQWFSISLSCFRQGSAIPSLLSPFSSTISHINSWTAGRGAKAAPPSFFSKYLSQSFFLNISVARQNFPLRFSVFLEPSKRDGMMLRFSNSPTRYRITSPEVKVVWMIFWWKYDKLCDHWIKGRKSPLEANSTLLRLFLRMPKSPLLIATCTIYTNSTGNQIGRRETGNT